MGEEWAATTPFQFFTDFEEPGDEAGRHRGSATRVRGPRLGRRGRPRPAGRARPSAARSCDWAELHEDDHARMLAWYRDLISLRRKEFDLNNGRLDTVGVDFDEGDGWFVVRRGAFRIVAEPGRVALDGAARREPGERRAGLGAGADPAARRTACTCRPSPRRSSGWVSRRRGRRSPGRSAPRAGRRSTRARSLDARVIQRTVAPAAFARTGPAARRAGRRRLRCRGAPGRRTGRRGSRRSLPCSGRTNGRIVSDTNGFGAGRRARTTRHSSSWCRVRQPAPDHRADLVGAGGLVEVEVAAVQPRPRGVVGLAEVVDDPRRQGRAAHGVMLRTP